MAIPDIDIRRAVATPQAQNKVHFESMGGALGGGAGGAPLQRTVSLGAATVTGHRPPSRAHSPPHAGLQRLLPPFPARAAPEGCTKLRVPCLSVPSRHKTGSWGTAVATFRGGKMGLVPKSVGKKRPSLQSRGAGPEEAARAGSEGREGPLLSSPEPGSPSLRVSGGGGGAGGRWPDPGGGGRRRSTARRSGDAGR